MRKAADALRRRGYTVFATVCGAPKVPNDDVLAILKDFTVRLWPDNDLPGRAQMDGISARLWTLRIPVFKVDWSDAPPKGDAADFTGNDDQLRALLDAAAPYPIDEAPPPDGGRPVVLVAGGQRSIIVDRIQAVLAAEHERWRIYEHGQTLVQPIVLEADHEDKIRRIFRPAGNVFLRMLTNISAADILTRAISFLKAPSLAPLDCPDKVAATLLSRAGDGRLPDLVGTIEAPIMRPDGSILDKPGYDPATGLYLASTEKWLPVPEAATYADVQAAIAALKYPLAQFPFITEADRSVVLAAILTGLQRRLLRSAPLFGLDAPIYGSGKSLLAELVALIVLGHTPLWMSAPETEDEWRKVLTAVLIDGDPIVGLDNVTKPLWSAALAKILTQPASTDRILGSTAKVTVPTNVLFLATGNNLKFARDLPSRSLVVRIDPKVEKPEEREFEISDLHKYIRDHRTALIQAALTILRAHHVAERPSMGLRPYGRFEQWNAEIRAALVFAGLADPCKSAHALPTTTPIGTHMQRCLMPGLDVFATGQRSFQG